MPENNNPQLMLMLGEMRGDIKSTHEKIDSFLKRMDDQHDRISVLEHFKTGLMAKVSIITIIVAGVWGIVIKKIA